VPVARARHARGFFRTRRCGLIVDKVVAANWMQIERGQWGFIDAASAGSCCVRASLVWVFGGARREDGS
jgi:hypothetical protein